jgi:rod shape-determining protein MreD
MNWLNSIILLLAAFVVVFLQSVITLFRDWVGAQPDLLPGLMVYVSLMSGLTNLTILAMAAGLWMDSLSANPMGVSVLPLFLIGYFLRNYRGLILKHQHYAQWILGGAASAAAPLLTLALLYTYNRRPLIGWFSLWQWFVMIVIGAAFTPVWFALFDRLFGALNYRAVEETSFRSDRQIKRGRM